MARDPETKKSVRVENLSYKEWYRKYVNGESEHEHTKSSNKNNVNSVNWDFIRSKRFKENIQEITEDKELNDLIHKKTLDILKYRQNTDYEDLVVIDRVSKKVIGVQRHSKAKLEVTSNKSIIDARRKYKDKIVIHNHPSNLPPSGSDLVSNFEKGNELGVVVCHDGEIFVYKTMEQFTAKIFDLSVKKYMDSGYNILKAYDKVLNNFEKKGWLRWKKLSTKD